MESVDWGPAIAFLAAGLVLGALILWRFASAPSAGAPSADAEPLERRDLEAKLDALVSQLRELDLLADTRTAEQLARERLDLELASARVLQQLERQLPAAGRQRAQPAPAAVAAASAAPAAAPQAPAPASSLRGFLWGVGSAAAIGLVLLFVSRSAEERGPSGSLTGNTPGAGQTAGPAEDAELRALAERVRQNPEDVEARLDLARLHLVRQDMMAVFDETQAVLQRQPQNPRALSYQALVRLAMGQGDRAVAMLEQALAQDPGLLDGYIHLMLVHTRTGRGADAEAVLARAIERFPDRAESLRGLLGELRQAAVEDAPPAATPAGEDPHAGVPLPGAAAPAAGTTADVPAPLPAGRSVSGTLELDAAGRAAFRPGTTVYVMLRDSGFGAGPPLAVRRLVASAFPLAFEIGQADSMSGEPIPDSVLIEARLDTDGDPVTRPPSDPYGREDFVKMGRTDVKLVLKPRS